MSAFIKSCEVAFAYPQDGRGLKPTSLQLGAGEVLLVAGPSGCGKSTLARCLAGLIPHLYRGDYRGQVLVNGESTAGMPLWRLAEQAGMVFQNPATQMLASTVEDEILFGLENLGLLRDEANRRLETALEQFGLAAMRQRPPLTLSGGEQQKLALAAVTARQPAALVLDEPLSMLDTTTALQFVSQTSSLVLGGTAVVYCEHRQEYLQSLPGLQTLTLDGGSLHDLTQEIPAWPFTTRDAVELHIQGLSVQRGCREILSSLDLDLPGGQVVAVVGRNGVGKTTLFRAITGLQKYSGVIQVDTGTAVESPQVGIVFQNPDLQLFNASVREEILYHLENPDLQLFDWLLAALGLERLAGAPPLLLSEGEKRRVALATVLMHKPRHGILLDEPALGQDAAHKTLLLKLLKAYAASGRLVVYSTHDLELAAQADTMVLLGPEGIAAMGPATSIVQAETTWERLGFVLPGWIKSQWSEVAGQALDR